MYRLIIECIYSHIKLCLSIFVRGNISFVDSGTFLAVCITFSLEFVSVDMYEEDHLTLTLIGRTSGVQYLQKCILHLGRSRTAAPPARRRHNCASNLRSPVWLSHRRTCRAVALPPPHTWGRTPCIQRGECPRSTPFARWS